MRLIKEKQTLNPFRENVLPNMATKLNHQRIAMSLIERCFSVHFKPKTVEEALLWVFYQLLFHGYGMEPAISILTHLRQADLQQDDQTLFRTPVHYHELGDYFHETELPDSLKTVFSRLEGINRSFQWVKRRQQHRQFGVMPSIGDPTLHTVENYQHRFNALRHLLQTAHQETLCEMMDPLDKIELGETLPAGLQKLSLFSQRVREQKLFDLPPALFNQLDKIPFPAESKQGIQQFLSKIYRNSDYRQTHPDHCPVRLQHVMEVPPNLHIEGEDVDNIERAFADEMHWFVHGKQLIDSFLVWLHQQQGRFKRFPKAEFPQLKQEIERRCIEACRFCPPESALIMGLQWIGWLLTKDDAQMPGTKRISIRTAKEYLVSIIRNGLLDIDIAVNMNEWSSSDIARVSEILCQRKRGKSDARLRKQKTELADNTLKKKHILIKSFFRYACHHNIIDKHDVNVDTRFEYSVSIKRNHVLSLLEFDELLRQLDQSRHEVNTLCSIVAILGFYGGMRHEEMRRLTLKDIEINRTEVFILIKQGKSPAARRRIPLHLLAPKDIVNRIRHHYQSRESLGIAQQPSTRASKGSFLRNPHQVAFLGPQHSINGLKDTDMSQIISLLKYYLGSDMDIHALRHSFSTWLCIRATLLQNPEALELMREQHHRLLQPECQRSFLQFLQPGCDDSLRPGHINIFIHIQKLIGHSHINVTFEHYLHAFGLMILIHNHGAS